jgi:hypothetical protein
MGVLTSGHARVYAWTADPPWSGSRCRPHKYSPNVSPTQDPGPESNDPNHIDPYCPRQANVSSASVHAIIRHQSQARDS